MGEAELMGAFREGQVADLARGGERGRVDAAFIPPGPARTATAVIAVEMKMPSRTMRILPRELNE